MTDIGNVEVNVKMVQEEKCCAYVYGNGNFFSCVMGKHDHGYFIAIMNWDICCELEGIYDSDYNRQRIFNKFNEWDGEVLCQALAILEDFYNEKCKK